MTCPFGSRARTLSKSRPSAKGDTSSTAGQSLSGRQWGQEGAAGLLRQPLTLSARWSNFHGNLLQYQQQLEGALQTHTLSRELDDITEQIREKVSSDRESGGVWGMVRVSPHTPESPLGLAPRPHLPFSWGAWR